MQSSEVERANTGEPGEAPKASSDDTTRAAGRGGLAIAVAKVSFILFGFAQQLLLPRAWLLGVDGYGAVRTVLSSVNVLNNVIVAVAIQGVSRAVSQVPDGEADFAFRRAMRVHVWVAMGVSLAFAAAAGKIADLLGASYLVTPIRAASLVVLMYGIYAPLVGSLNGRRRFLDQAGLDIAYGMIRLAAMVGGAIAFKRAGSSGVLGAIVGFVGAAAIIAPIAMTRSRLGKDGGTRPELREYLGFLLPLAAGQLFLNLLMQTDFFLLSHFVGHAAGVTEAGIKTANTLRGVYAGAQQFAFLPYQLLMSITFILFPLLAKASAEGDRNAVRSYTMTGVRLGLVLTGLMCGAVSAAAPHVLRLAFPKEIWSQGGEALRILALGMGSFTILGISCAALTGLGKAVHSMLLTLLGAAGIATGCYVMIPRAELGAGMLVNAATATTVALTVAAIAGSVVLRQAAGGFVAARSMIRVLVALGVTVAIGPRLPWLGLAGVVAEVAALAAVYLAILIVTGELGKADLALVMKVAGRGKR